MLRHLGLGLILGMSQLGSCLGGTLDAASLRRLLDAAGSPVQDYSCEYESKITILSGPVLNSVGPDGTAADFTGSVVFRDERTFFLDLFKREFPKFNLHRETIAVFRGRAEVYSRAVDRVGDSGLVRPTNLIDFELNGGLGHLYLKYGVYQYINHLPKSIVHVGQESLGDRPCEVIDFITGTGPGTKPTQKGTDRYWLDLGRGGHPLQHVNLDHESTVRAKTTVVLEKFQTPQNVDTWFPVACERFLFPIDPKADRTKPVELHKFSVMTSSLRFNTNPSDETFRVKFRPSTLVTDSYKKLTAEFAAQKRTAPVSVVEAESRLKEQLKAADEQGDELKAASWDRGGGRGWLAWAPWLLTIAAIAALGFVLARRARAR